MKFPKQKIEKIAIADKNASGREHLNGVYYDKETDSFLVSNGFAAARIPAENSNALDESALIPLSKFKEYRKLKAKAITVKDENKELSKQFREGALDFINGHFPESSEYPIIVVDAKRLHELAQVICEKDPYGYGGLFVKLHLPRVNQPMLVLPVHGEGGKGILMEVQSRPSYVLRNALDELTEALETGDEINKTLREKLRRALCDRI